jgi:hypothetical protein
MEINFSRVPVGANIGGLVFVLGSVLAIVVGLPEARLFFAASAVLGLVVAVGLYGWHLRERSPDDEMTSLHLPDHERKK